MRRITRDYRESVLERMAAVNAIPKLESLQPYALTHTHDESPRQFYIKAPYSEDTMNVLIAFIQFASSELDECFGMDQADIIDVLKELYDCEPSQDPLPDAAEIDLYLNWEIWCGVGDRVQALEYLGHDRLNGILQGFIDTWLKKNPA
ncbi:hypothetical protein [Cohnella soli]|uniref:Uncharacterized protein n=1 Tax=Cohnella soli TaxID=425005 RepID=A0ABW0HTI5_9BACL